MVKSIAARPRLHPRSTFIHPLTSNALTGKAAILAALQPPAGHHRISQSPVVGSRVQRDHISADSPYLRTNNSPNRISHAKLPLPRCLPKNPSTTQPSHARRGCPLRFLTTDRGFITLKPCSPLVNFGVAFEAVFGVAFWVVFGAVFGVVPAVASFSFFLRKKMNVTVLQPPS